VSWKAYQTIRAPEELIHSWFERQFVGAGLGLVTGTVSGLVVVDIDAPDDAEFDIAEHGGLPQTPSVRTAKGVHYYFLHPLGGAINGKLPWGDLKGDGGYVLAPPTIHPDTHEPYTWITSPKAAPLAPLPEWIAALCEQVPVGGNGNGHDQHKPAAPPVDEEIAPGRRNSTLASLAGSLRRRGLSAEEIYPALLAVNDGRCRPPLDPSEVWTIAQSASRYTPEHSMFIPGAVDEDEAKFLNALPTTDSGNAEALAHLYDGGMLFDHTAQRWLLWDGNRWAQDRDGEPQRLAKRAARQRLGAAAQAGGDDKCKALVKWAVASENRTRLDSALKLASTELPLAATGEKFDADPYLLGCANGVLDLRTGTLGPGRPELYISLSCNVEYDPAAAAPRWEQFLQEIFCGDAALIKFARRAIGYTLTGAIREQCLFLCHGTGANGKSVFLAVLHGLLGEYSTNTDFATFLDAYGQSGSAATPDLVALKGARLVTASEVKEDRRLNEARIKSLTGGDPVTGRPLYGRPMTFTPEFKLWLAVNHRPRVSETGMAIWRRIHLIPFNARFGPGQADPDLGVKLRSELPGILAWAVAGCMGWQAEGLTPPDAVRLATQGYRNEQDVLGAFLDACCVVGDGKEVSAASLYKSYRGWCEASGEKPLSSIALGQRLGEQFVRTHTRTGAAYHGVGLVDQSDNAEKRLL
jgi:putative DNA primase/helicase